LIYFEIHNRCNAPLAVADLHHQRPTSAIAQLIAIQLLETVYRPMRPTGKGFVADFEQDGDSGNQRRQIAWIFGTPKLPPRRLQTSKDHLQLVVFLSA
jgi:hypothetical protein